MVSKVKSMRPLFFGLKDKENNCKKNDHILQQETIAHLKKLAAKGDELSLPRIPDPLKFKHLHVGMKLLGRVASISDVDIRVSLPNQLVGFVSVSEITVGYSSFLEQALSNEDTDETESKLDIDSKMVAWKNWFHVGQLVPVAVIHLERAVISKLDKNKINSAESRGRSKHGTISVLEQHNRIELSLKPSLVNSELTRGDIRVGRHLPVEVFALQEKGVLVKLGSEEAFLSYEENIERESLQVGTWLYVKIVSADSRILQVVSAKDFPSIGTKSAMKEIHFQNLLPGDYISSDRLKVVKVVPNRGLIVRLSDIDCEVSAPLWIIDIQHIPAETTLPKLSNHYIEGSILSKAARVLYYNNSPNGDTEDLVALTLLPSLVNGESFGPLPDIGVLLTGLIQVIRIDPHNGILVRIGKCLPDQINNHIDEINTNQKISSQMSISSQFSIVRTREPYVGCGYIHATRLIDGKRTPVGVDASKYTVGKILENGVRVIGYYGLEGGVALSLQPSTLSARYFSLSNLSVGELVRGKIIKLLDSGAVVELSEQLRGFCPVFHYSERITSATCSTSSPKGDESTDPVVNDCRLKNLRNVDGCPFIVNQKVNFRVWSICDNKEPGYMNSNGRLLLTAKPSLIEDSEALVAAAAIVQSDISSSSVLDMSYLGIVVSIKPKIGAIIAFYNNIRGFLPIKLVREGYFVKDLEKILPIGSVVRVWRVATSRESHDSNVQYDPAGTLKLTMTPPQTIISSIQEDAAFSSGLPQESTNAMTMILEESAEAQLAMASQPPKKRSKSEKSKLENSGSELLRVNKFKPSSIECILEDVSPLYVSSFLEAEFSTSEVNNSSSNDTWSLKGVAQPASTTPTQKKKNKRLLEVEISQLEEDSQNPSTPNSVESFEKALLAKPADLVLWLQYISYSCASVKTAPDLTKTRALIQRALETIPFAGDADKLKIWAAALRMEWMITLGLLLPTVDSSSNLNSLMKVREVGAVGNLDNYTVDSDEFLNATIKDALLRNEPLKIYLLIWDIYLDSYMDRSSDLKIQERVVAKLSELESILIRKNSSVKHNIDVWERIYTWYLLQGDKFMDLKKERYETALRVYITKKDEQALFMSRIANLEFKMAIPSHNDWQTDLSPADFVNWPSIEYARTLFETLLSSFPKRSDFWIQYMQKEQSLLSKLRSDASLDKKNSAKVLPKVAQDTLTSLRLLFERAISMTNIFTKRQMKSFFKAFLDVEDRFGDTKSVLHVKKLAASYVSSQLEKEQ